MSANDPKRTFSKFCCLSVSKIETFRRLVRRYLPGCSRSPEGVTFAACSPRGGAMTDPCSRRKLTAILSADAVGYSRLMAADEAATVETLKAYRDIIVRLVARHGGRVVNAPGDALLAEFPSAVEAVQAAIEIQQSVEGHNIELEADRRMQFRIGVNLGDVIEEADGTIYGDGVNIAAPGGPRRGRQGLHLLHCLRRRRGQAFLRIRFSRRAAGQEYCEACACLLRARRVQATVAARSAKAPHAMADRRAGLGADPGPGRDWRMALPRPLDADAPRSGRGHRDRHAQGSRGRGPALRQLERGQKSGVFQ